VHSAAAGSRSHRAVRPWPVLMAAVVAGVAAIVLAVWQQPDLATSQRASLALDLPARAEVSPAAVEARDVPSAEVEARDVPSAEVGSVGPHCVGGLACRVWQVDLPAGTEPGSIVTGDRTVVVPSIRELRAYDARTGASRWSVAVRAPGNRVVAPRAALAGGLVLVVGTGERLHAYDLDDGERRWSTTVKGLEHVRDARELDGQLLVLGARPDQRSRLTVLLALDPADGTVGWQIDVDGAVLTDVGPVSQDRRAGLRGHDPRDGRARWSALEGRAVGDLRAAGPLALVAAAEERLLLDAATGEQVAQLARLPMIGPLPVESATVVPGDDRAVLVDGDGVAWDAAVAGGCCTGHLVAVDEVVVRRTDGSVLVLDRDDGEVVEERAPLGTDSDEVGGWLLGSLEFSALPDEDGTDLRLQVHDLRTGRLLDELPTMAPVAVLGNDVVVASYDRMLRLTSDPNRFGPTGSLLTQ
jgi:outer membrane protein assembly factor BamB